MWHHLALCLLASHGRVAKLQGRSAIRMVDTSVVDMFLQVMPEGVVDTPLVDTLLQAMPDGTDPTQLAGVGAGAGATALFLSQASRPQARMPQLFDGWFDGQIERQACAAVQAARRDGINKLEVSFPPVPNLEEVSFGTVLNQKFQVATANTLGLGAKNQYGQVKRDPVGFGNAVWARKLARGCGGGRPVILQNLDLSRARRAGQGVVEAPLARPPPLRKGDCVIAVNPIGRWPAVDALNSGATIMLNTAFSEGYDLGGPLGDYEQVYYLKRVSKGWVYRGYPGKWQAYLELPNGGVELLEEYRSKPALREVSERVRAESFGRYGLFNDRYAKGFGGRL